MPPRPSSSRPQRHRHGTHTSHAVPTSSCSGMTTAVASPLYDYTTKIAVKRTAKISVKGVAKYLRLLGDVDKKEYHRRAWYPQHTIFPFLVWWLSEVQHSLSVRGSVGEIGVHHGGFFLALASASARGEPLFVIDLFDKLQHLNVDGSGRGAWSNFSANLALLGLRAENIGAEGGVSRGASGRAVRAVVDASTNIDGRAFATLAQLPVRMFSIDGGHTRESTCHDLNLADSYLHDGGVVIVDDVGCCNRESSWGLGVIDGLFSFFNASGPRRLEPFLYVSPKLFLARPEAARRYATALRSDLELQPSLRFKEGWRELSGRGTLHPTRYTLFGGQVAMPGRLPAESEVAELWYRLLVKSAAAHSLEREGGTPRAQKVAAAAAAELHALHLEQELHRRGPFGRLALRLFGK